MACTLQSISLLIFVPCSCKVPIDTLRTIPSCCACPLLYGTASARPQEPWSAAVVPSLSHTVEWLRQYARSSPRLQLQVLVTGSLYLVGDVLRMLGKLPK